MSNTAILFTCPGCKLVGQARPEWVGKKLKCPRCGHQSRVPVPGQETTSNDTPAVAPPEPASAAPETLHDIHVKAGQTHWEYQVVRHEPATDGDLAARMAEDLNARGADGWECVGVFQQPQLFLVYKRPRT